MTCNRDTIEREWSHTKFMTCNRENYREGMVTDSAHDLQQGKLEGKWSQTQPMTYNREN